MSSIDPTAYPFANPGGDFLWFNGRVLDVNPETWPQWAEGRTAVLAYGSNAAPEQLRRKFGDLDGEVSIPTFLVMVRDFDVVYAALIARYGSVPATIHHCPGAVASTFLQFLDERELARMDETEGLGSAYTFEDGFVALRGRDRVDASAYIATAGPLLLDGSPVGLGSVEVTGSPHPRRGQGEVLEAVRLRHAPDLTFDAFLAKIVENADFRAEITLCLRGSPPRGPRSSSAPEGDTPFRSGE